MSSRTLLSGIASSALVIISAASMGCTAQATAEPDPGPGPVVASTGTVTVDWTLNESTDSSQCQISGASEIHITPYDSAGNSMGEFAQDCTAFATTIQLPEGHYTADAVLEDQNGGARTTTITISPFTVIDGSPLSISVDFPANSFYQ